MKKIFLFTAVLSAFTFSSCKKDRVCTCTTVSTTTTTIVKDWATSPTQTTTSSNADGGSETIVYKESKKKDAKKACIDYRDEYSNSSSYDGTYYDWSTGSSENYTQTTTNKTVTEGTCSLK